MPPPLTTPRLVLVAPTFDAVPAIAALAADRRIADMTATLPARDPQKWTMPLDGQ